MKSYLLSKLPRVCSLAIAIFAAAMTMTSVQAQIQTAGTLFVNIDATTVAAGALADITNSGSLGGFFETRPGGISIGTTNGVNGIQFVGTNYMVLLNGVGGALIPPPSGLVGANATASIEVWVYNPSVADDECMVAWGRRGTTGQNMAFEYGYNAGLGAVTHTGAANDIGWDNFGGTPLNNRWHHLVYTYDGTTESVYVDGSLVNSKAASFTIATNAGISLAAQWTNNASNTGTVISNAPAFATLGLARVRIHDGALTASQVLANFNTEKATFIALPPVPQFLTAGPVHRYSFNEPVTNDATGLLIHDSIGTAHGVVQGLPGSNTVGQFYGGRLLLPGGPQNTTAYGDLPNGLLSANSTNNGGSGEVSIEVWYKNTGGQSLSWARVFDFGSVGTNGVPGMELTGPGGFPAAGSTGPDTLYYSAQMTSGINQRRLGWQNKDPLPAGSTTNSAATQGDVFTMGTFQTDRHIVVTWQESTGQIIAYENGTQVAAIVATNAISAINDVNLWLGRSQGGFSDTGLAGEYDEVRFYTNILSAGQALGDFQVGPDTINTSEQAASIVVQPQNATVLQGSPASFYVIASGSPAVSYQWKRNGSNIPGATANTFNLTAVTMANNAESYSCVVSNFTSSTPHTLTSSSATLTVVPNQAPPAQFLRETRDGNRNNYNTATSGQVGGLFTSGATPGPVTHLGFYDLNKDGLFKDHHVGIFNSSGLTLLASVVVPAGTSAYLTNGYRWVALNPPLMLTPNTTYILEAEVFNGDGDGWPDIYIPGSWNPYFVGTNGPATRQARFSGGVWPSNPTSTSTLNASYGAPNLATLPIGPVIATMLQTSVTQYSGLTLSVPVIANGQGPVSIQWYKAPSTPLTGQTNSSLVIPAVSLADAGDYYVIANNAFGPSQSANVTVTILPGSPVTITQQPTNTTIPEGYPVSFSITAGGTPPYTYQWSHNGSPVAGATNSIFSLAAVSLANNGDSYSCVVSNVADGIAYSTNSSSAILTVQPNKALALQFLHEPAIGNRDDYNGVVGGNFLVGATDALVTHVGYYDMNGDGLNYDHRVGIFSPSGLTLLTSAVVPAGTGGYLTNGYRWVALNPPFVLTNNTAYIFAAEVFSGSGDVWPDVFVPTNWNTYFVGANDGTTRAARFGSGTWPSAITSGTAANAMYAAGNLAVLPIGLPTVAMQQSNITIYAGQSVTLSTTVNGEAPLTLQWYKAPSTLLPGQTNTSLVLSNLAVSASGDYYAIATNPQGSTQGNNVTLNVLALTPPIITQQPQPQSVYLHQQTTFSVSAIGQQPLSYQWKFNGTPISGATGSAFTLLDASNAKIGDYQVTITNSLGTTNSALATLSLLSVPEGSYEAAVLNANPLIYYRFNEVGGTNVAFNLGSLGTANNGTYQGSIGVGAGPQPPDFFNFESTNSAPTFDAQTTDIRIPALNLNSNAPVAVTLAAWINRSGPQQTYAGIIFFRGTGGANGFGIKQDLTSGADVLEYHWNNTYFSFASQLYVPDSQWVLAALVVQPTKATLYIHDNIGLLSATNVAAHAGVSFSENTTYVGWDAALGSTARRFYGMIDEAMIFDRALTPADLNALYNAAATQSVKLTSTFTGSSLILSWPAGTLQQADEAAGPYSDMTGVTSPYTNAPSAGKKFYRVKVQ
ncbi:MAG: Immunoglobulin I-set domain protein [Pedosphaera sp.]|nr:Immunoglobulin I-set domain protein [Pedosphaera sp.]